MNDDSDRMREIQERLVELQRENQAADADAAHAEPVSPVAPVHRPGRRRGWMVIASLLLASVVFAELALTVQGWSSPDFGEAGRIGRATIVSCERQGPIGRGIGYWHRCTADVVWDGGFSGRYTFDRRNFIHADEAGTTITIGENGGARSTSVGYSRPEAPYRPLVAALGVSLAIVAAVPALLLLAAAFSAVRNRIRRARS
ncbi:DUF6346 domain-containing protein [Couchioplanes caeruleus]|uniref:Uncharacterized protein n=2 Tax=Couchioplanes caeruleus TaxID=56438 RepID=A0A1K0GR22_9ACTN|nr:DUF6346 domain-containing protein [Couchioplanes caeruleus]OJF14854.1 hypothetical protein BG844_07475 [Couchioplanes caeruleus subsp. caeruleus]ROP32150.1 hypothetical protein EDD30_5081 [Couchioplanes caeruleus]